MSHEEIQRAYNCVFLAGEHPGLEFRIEKSTLNIGLPGVKPAVRIFQEEDGHWTVQAKEWHSHFDHSGKALWIGVGIVAGRCRTVNEFRGETLSATWLEIFEGEQYEVRGISYFLNPFDKGEWELFPGERWRVLRYSDRLVEAPKAFSDLPLGDAGLGLEVGENREDESFPDWPYIARSGGMFDFYPDKFGPPHEGMRWTLDRHNFFVFQLPDGWRLNDRDIKPGKTEFWSGVEGLAIRVITSFRKPVEPVEFKREEDGSTRAATFEYTHEPICEHSPEWSLHKWQMYFPDDVEEMLAIVYLYASLELGNDPEPLRALFAATLPEARYYIPS